MDKYESLEVVGEGSYGVVIKCRHRETGQTVAIKKFLETEEDVQVRRMALREIRMLKKLRHENLVNMIEVFRRRKRFYLVFEYLDHTLLDELSESGSGLGWEVARRYIFQVLRGLHFCHGNHIMHRDVKPENILVSRNGVVKLCDFGFARLVPGGNDSCTDYVATRWYRAPELLIGDSRYGRGVDVWAVGCLYAEMITGEPLFPGDTDVDQLHRITRILGGLCCRHQTMIVRRTGHGRMLRHASVDELSVSSVPASGPRSLRGLFPDWPTLALDFLGQSLKMDPDLRPRCSTLLQHPLFVQDGFADRFLVELQRHVARESAMNPLLGRLRSERRLSLVSADSQPGVCRSGTGRWQMTATRGVCPRVTDHGESNKPVEEERQQPKIIDEQQIINRPRGVCHFGPVSVIPNTTYIRRLEHNKGVHLPETKVNSLLPVLRAKETARSKGNGKRRRIDLPCVDR